MIHDLIKPWGPSMQLQTCRWLVFICICLNHWSAACFFGFGSSIFNLLSDNTNKFQIYWNVPTFMCHKYGMDFGEVSNKFGFIQNENDQFRGDNIVILYDPGNFPALLKDNQDNIVWRNGGLPQEGNLSLHLHYFRQHLEEQIPNPNFSGIAIIDFESWRPIFRQNWASLQIYRDLSIEIERQRHPFWTSQAITLEATHRFENFGKLFMKKTLEMAKNLRPNAEWGYYAYPYCFNLKQPNGNCDPKVFGDNNRMSWLFENSNILLPSVYLPQQLTPSERVNLVSGIVQEAMRLSRRFHKQQNIRVLPYYWYKYQDRKNIFLQKSDIVNTIQQIVKHGSDGMIIWGSSNDLNNLSKCENFQAYFQQILGPAILQAQYLYKS